MWVEFAVSVAHCPLFDVMFCHWVGPGYHSAFGDVSIPLIELSYLSVFDLSRQRPDSWNDPGSPAYISKVGSMAEETLILHLKHF